MDDNSTRNREKEMLAEYIISLIPRVGVIGLGSGSTVNEVIKALHKKGLNHKKRLRIVPASLQTKLLLQQYKFHVIDFWDVTTLDMVIDGADQVDPEKNLIKGGGGALLKEKILASATDEYMVLCDQSKRVRRLGGNFALPIEVLPYGAPLLLRHLEEMRIQRKIRESIRGNPFITENGNFIIDASFTEIQNPKALDQELRQYPEVITTGLFYDLNPTIFTFDKDEIIEY